MKPHLTLILASALAFASCASHQTPGELRTGDDCIAQTIYGQVQGYCDDGIYTFKGIRYAKAERFMAPEAPDSWEGVLKTQAYGPKAMQGQSVEWTGQPSDYDFGFEFKNEKLSEDCQVLNVWTPALDGKKRPVFLWIHGGGYASGSAIFLPAQDGRSLAERGDIVVVTVNHRLNVLGYIDLTALGGKYSESVNLGQQDLVKALEWVHDNIEAFGGDPGCVTIGGQSGGGGKTSTLMAMPSAQGLFHRAIVQSGSTLRQAEPEQSRALGLEFVKQLGLEPGPDVDLSGFTYEELNDAANRASRISRGGRLSPVVDGKYLVQHPFDPVAPECSRNVPMLIGSNLNEFCYTNNIVIDEAQARERLAASIGADKCDDFIAEFDRVYPGQSPKEWVNTDFRTRGRVLEQATVKSAQGAAPAYVYLFTFKSGVNDGALAACHGMELPFMFANVAAQREMTGGTVEAYKVEDIVSSAWISFIRTGRPSAKGLPAWEPFTAENGATMVLDGTPKLEHHHDAALLEYFK